MSKETKHPYIVNGELYLDGKKLDCHKCKYYNDGSKYDTGIKHCDYHNFKFEGNYKLCEHFEYAEDAQDGSGCCSSILIFVLVLVIIKYVF